MVCPFLLPGRAVCPALGTGGRWTPWHAARPPGASDRATKSALLDQAADLLVGPRAELVGGALAAGGRACHLPSGQIPPPWARWENEAPATRAARRPRPRQRVTARSCDAQGLRQVEEKLPLPLLRPLACDLAQQADELAAVGRRELLELEGEIFQLLHGGVRIQGGVVCELQEHRQLSDDLHEYSGHGLDTHERGGGSAAARSSWRRGVGTCWAGRWNNAPDGLCGSTTVRT